MASEERTRGLLERAGFTVIRTEEVPVAFAFGDVDEYVRWRPIWPVHSRW